MNIYVDELPIGAIEFSCDNCPYAEIQGINHYFINNEFVSYRDCVCKLDKTCGFKDGQKTCPIQSLTNHDKQVRKEVVQEIRDMLKDMDFLAHETELGERIDCFSKYKVLDILIRVEDQIQGVKKMRIIKDETQRETIVKCPDCKSIFSYTEQDIYNKYTINQLRCPCCDTNHMVWEYEELEVDNA